MATVFQNIRTKGDAIIDSELRLNDDDNSAYMGFKSPAAVTANKLLTLLFFPCSIVVLILNNTLLCVIFSGNILFRFMIH